MNEINWTIEDSRALYGIGKNFREFHFLDINEKGELCLKIQGQIISIKTILETVYTQIKEQLGDITQAPSLTLRIPQLVEYQIEKIVSSFNRNFNEFKYQGKFHAVYPIKVNQQAHAIKTVLDSKIIQYGLEAGTKAEFIITLEALKEKREHLIVCNGVKDEDYLGLALRKLNEGWNILISIETLRELETLYKIDPDFNSKICLRLKPYIPVSGHWAHSSGRDSKFGLSIAELDEILNFLISKKKKNILFALHAHIGSQITSLTDFKALAEYLTSYYTFLRKEGYDNLQTLNFGGGLPIDYEGLVTVQEPDTIEFYVQNIVKGIISNIEENTHPNILIEVGRGITALSSLVLVQILEIKDIYPQGEVLGKNYYSWKKKIDSIQSLDDFMLLYKNFKDFDIEVTSKCKNMVELKNHEHLIGFLRLKFREKIIKHFDSAQITKILQEPQVNELLIVASKFAIGNFSVFNSACDYVLVNQYFPIFPIEFLNFPPETLLRLVDITCDSDGEMNRFLTKRNKKLFHTNDNFLLSFPEPQELQGIPVANVNGLNESYLAIALTGAYQDIIQFDHNLLGNLPDVEIRLNHDGWKIRWISSSESTSNILAKVGFRIPDEEYTLIKTSYAKDSWNR
ncbi:hypothetical protein [Candidatus Hodarchaeum mangrovi]